MKYCYVASKPPADKIIINIILITIIISGRVGPEI